MSDEIQKKVFVGEDPNVTATVTEEDRDAHNLSAHHTRDLVREAGRFQAPIGTQYLGSMVAHCYSKSGLNEETKEYFTVCQCDLGKVAEGHADISWKNLRDACLKAYGRKTPKTRDN